MHPAGRNLDDGAGPTAPTIAANTGRIPPMGQKGPTGNIIHRLDGPTNNCPYVGLTSKLAVSRPEFLAT
jgi:hypothetical protein